MKRWTMLLAVLGVALLAALLIPASPVPGRADDEGGVVFSHEVHKDKAECDACHAAATSTSACDNLLPKPEACAACHEAKDVRGYWSLKDEDPLDRNYLTPKNRQLYFSHAAHVGGQKLACAGCHAGIATEGMEPMPAMRKCAFCHNDGEALDSDLTGATPALAANRCELCHVTLAGLMPDYHRSAGFQRLHGRWADKGADEGMCAACHAQSFCQTCHAPTNDVPAIGGTAYYQPAWPRGEKMDDERMTSLQTMHSLTYRYTHGFEARAQSIRCQTCHEPETFCTPCHRNGYDAVGARIVPQSHQMAGFVTLGGSKALNRHAKLAEMDLESCATCHDVDGGDPVCAVCHSTGLVKGEKE
jgi:c(7)-type cytochrome triheme protein